MKTGNGHNQPVLPVEKNYYHPLWRVDQLKVIQWKKIRENQMVKQQQNLFKNQVVKKKSSKRNQEQKIIFVSQNLQVQTC